MIIQFYTGLFGIGICFSGSTFRPVRRMSSGFQKALKILISPRGAYEQRSILVHIAIKVNERERLLKSVNASSSGSGSRAGLINPASS